MGSDDEDEVEATLDSDFEDDDEDFICDETFNANVAEMLSTFTKEGRISCMAHSLQLAVKDALEADKDAKNIVCRFKRILSFFYYSFFSKSTHWSGQFKEQSGGLDFIKPGETRWNSILFALERTSDVS